MAEAGIASGRIFRRQAASSPFIGRSELGGRIEQISGIRGGDSASGGEAYSSCRHQAQCAAINLVIDVKIAANFSVIVAQ